jgi:hypothetical protein
LGGVFSAKSGRYAELIIGALAIINWSKAPVGKRNFAGLAELNSGSLFGFWKQVKTGQIRGAHWLLKGQ